MAAGLQAQRPDAPIMHAPPNLARDNEMKTIHLEHDIACDEETFWKTYFDRELSSRLFREGLGFPVYEILEQRETPTETIRKVRAQPKLDVPAAVAKLLGPGFGYAEDSTFDKTSRVWRYKMTMSVMADRLLHEGQMHVVPAAPGHVRRIASLRFEARVFGVGGMLEAAGEKQLTQSWADSAVAMNKLVSETRA